MSIARSLRFCPWTLVTGLCLLYCLAVIVVNQGDPLALVTLGTQFSQGISKDAGGTEGYDGQFVYYIARDPSAAAQYLDVPAYRFQRILLPMAARVLALAQAALIPWALLVINLAALAIGTALVEHFLAQHKQSRWYALAYGLTLGAFGSVRLSLPEPLTYALVLVGIWLMGRDRWLWGGVCFALAALAKETALFFVAGYGLYFLVQRRWAQAILFGAVASIPFLIWQAVLVQHFGTLGIGAGGAQATSFEVIPFAGVIRIVTDVRPEARIGIALILAPVLIPFVLIPTVWGLWRCWRERGRWTVYTYLLFATAGIMPFVPFSTYREPIGILRFIVGLQISVILYAAAGGQARVLRNSTIWVVTTLFVFALFPG
jgi:hypothetical protein